MTETFLYDTYAIIEIIKGNENYENYADEDIVINNFIFAELCWNLIKKGYPNPEESLEEYTKFIASIKPSLIQKAMKTPSKMTKKLSNNQLISLQRQSNLPYKLDIFQIFKFLIAC